MPGRSASPKPIPIAQHLTNIHTLHQGHMTSTKSPRAAMSASTEMSVYAQLQSRGDSQDQSRGGEELLGSTNY